MAPAISLASVAAQMQQKLPTILSKRAYHGYDALQAAKLHEVLTLNIIADGVSDCPNLPLTKVRVVNQDTITAALQFPYARSDPPPLIMNFANESKPGGSWLDGASAQEEALFYRSSLSLSLHPSLYPLGKLVGVYSPAVFVVREDNTKGYKPLRIPSKPMTGPAVSAISISALRNPKIKTIRSGVDCVNHHTQYSKTPEYPFDVFESATDRAITKDMMRVTLYAAATRGHTRIVLGAFGCGVFKNPAFDIACCWKEVLEENFNVAPENGHWWDDLVFAVYGSETSDNLKYFRLVFQDCQV